MKRGTLSQSLAITSRPGELRQQEALRVGVGLIPLTQTCPCSEAIPTLFGHPPRAGLRFPSEPSWVFPGRRQGSPGSAVGLPRGMSGGPSWAVTHSLSVWLWALSTVSLWKGDRESLGPFGPSMCVCVGTRCFALSHLLVSYMGHTHGLCQPGARLPAQCLCSTHLGDLYVLISDQALSSSLICLWPSPVSPGLRPIRAGIHCQAGEEVQGPGTLSPTSVPSSSTPAPRWEPAKAPTPHRNLLIPEALG